MKEFRKDLFANLVVLYVEDEQAVREEVTTFLSKYVKEIYVAKNGYEGIALFNEHSPDLIITDLQMPKLNGVDMLKEINYKRTPVIVTTAHSDVDYFLKAIELQVNKFIIKPMELTQLMEDIQDCFLTTHLKDKLFEKEGLLNIVDENVLLSVTDKKGVIIDVSSAFCDFVEYPKDELIGKTHQILKHEDNPDDFYKNMWKEIMSGKVFKSEIRNRKKTGEIYWANLTITPVFKDKEIVNFTAIRQDITNKKKLELLSIEDDLTKLYNRRYFNKIISKEIRRIKRDDSSCVALLTFDIDYFKKYNDTYGHPKGDEVLVKVSNTLKGSTSRATDYVFRMGGEEFAIIFSPVNKVKAFEYAKSIVKKIENLKIEHENSSVSKFVTISAGLIVQSASSIESQELLYKLSDEALYYAKENGRNQVFISEASN